MKEQGFLRPSQLPMFQRKLDRYLQRKKRWNEPLPSSDTILDSMLTQKKHTLLTK